MSDVQDLGPIGLESAALDINNNGMVAGQFRDGDADVSHAFVQVPPYDQAGILTKLSAHTGTEASSANAVNIHGWVAGSFTRNTTTRAFVYDSSQDVLRDLQVLLGPLGFKDSSATGINDNGDVIGTGSLGIQTRTS